MKDEKGGNDKCCESKEMENEKPSQECLANQLLAAQDATGMDLNKATEILADENSDCDAKAAADEMLSLADEGNFEDMKCAEKVLANEASGCCDEQGKKGEGEQKSKIEEESDSISKIKPIEVVGADEEQFNKPAIGSQNDKFGTRAS